MICPRCATPDPVPSHVPSLLRCEHCGLWTNWTRFVPTSRVEP